MFGHRRYRNRIHDTTEKNMRRRSVLTGACGLAACAALSHVSSKAAGATLQQNLADVWESWKLTHLEGTGRVVDSLQQGSSHSEGQAYGMLLATTFDDRRAFEKMETWLKVNLAVRPDSLSAWRWLPNEAERVPDTNNASDADIFRAWALLKASQKFSVAEYRELAQQIVIDLIASCIVERDDIGAPPLLLPAAQGFVTAAGFIINPSYSMPIAMSELARAFNLPILERAADGAVALLAKLAQEGPVPDWLEIVGDSHGPADGLSYNSGYEAMRVPLFLIWSGLKDHPAVRRYAQAQMRSPEGSVATVFESVGGKIVETSSQAGYKSIAALSICATQNLLGSDIPPYVASEPYYPGTLHIFAMIAQAQAVPMCFPV